MFQEIFQTSSEQLLDFMCKSAWAKKETPRLVVVECTFSYA